MQFPTFQEELTLIASGYRAIAGVDEAGCGALAGPVVAGAVILPMDLQIDRLRDSKMVPERERELLYAMITEKAEAWAVGIAHVEEIEAINVRQATFLAMRRALEQIKPDFALVDAWTIPGIAHPQKGIIRGDAQVMSISAAAIIAKVSRDRFMRKIHDLYPEYGFNDHKGYGTQRHRDAISRHGLTAIHRPSFCRNIE